MAGSKEASGGRSVRDVCGSYPLLSISYKASSKSGSIRFASLTWVALPSHTGGTAWEIIPGSVEAACVSRRTIGSWLVVPSRCVDLLYW